MATRFAELLHAPGVPIRSETNGSVLGGDPLTLVGGAVTSHERGKDLKTCQ